MVSNHSEISALVALITDASKIVEQHYANSAIHAIPSLNDIESHPLDNAIYDADLRNAIQIIEGACLQLTATVARPNHTIVNVSYSFIQYPDSIVTHLSNIFSATHGGMYSQHRYIPTVCLHIHRDMSLAV